MEWTADIPVREFVTQLAVELAYRNVRALDWGNYDNDGRLDLLLS
jgi:hypothetical protein